MNLKLRNPFVSRDPVVADAVEPPIANLLIAAAEGYLEWCKAFAVRPPAEEEAECVRLVRHSGGDLAEVFEVARLLVDAEGLVLPAPVQRLFRALDKSYSLMADVETYHELAGSGLARAEDVERDFNDPITTVWLRKYATELSSR